MPQGRTFIEVDSTLLSSSNYFLAGNQGREEAKGLSEKVNRKQLLISIYLEN